jgi:hypothetical protein
VDLPADAPFRESQALRRLLHGQKVRFADKRFHLALPIGRSRTDRRRGALGSSEVATVSTAKKPMVLVYCFGGCGCLVRAEKVRCSECESAHAERLEWFRAAQQVRK